MNPKYIIQAWQALGLPNAVAEHRFFPGRKWRFDFAFVDQFVAVEVQGGLWTRGRHTRGPALLKEHEKLNHAASLGWVIMYCPPGGELKTNFVNILRSATL